MKTKTQKIIIVILILLLVLGIIWMIYILKEKNVTYNENLKMMTQLNELMEDYNSVKQENLQFQNELSEKDSVILANSQEIEKLIYIQGDYRKVQKKMELLRRITQDYASRVDSLLIINEQLQTENEEYKAEIKTQKDRNKQLYDEKNKLDEKITEAAVLRAYNVRAYGLRKRFRSEVETTKASRIEKLVIDFTIGENSLVVQGEKNIYIRVARPDGQVLTPAQSDDYSFQYQGTTLQYSLHKAINYTGKEQKNSVVWIKADKKSDAMEGIYEINLYEGDVIIGHATITLD